jgi:hypothetical protein
MRRSKLDGTLYAFLAAELQAASVHASRHGDPAPDWDEEETSPGTRALVPCDCARLCPTCKVCSVCHGSGRRLTMTKSGERKSVIP